MSKITIAKGLAAIITGAGAPWLNYLAGVQDLSPRMLALTAVASLIAGASAGAAFLSTSVATDQATGK